MIKSRIDKDGWCTDGSWRNGQEGRKKEISSRQLDLDIAVLPP